MQREHSAFGFRLLDLRLLHGKHYQMQVTRGKYRYTALRRAELGRPPNTALWRAKASLTISTTAGHCLVLDIGTTQIYCTCCSDYIYDSQFDEAILVQRLLRSNGFSSLARLCLTRTALQAQRFIRCRAQRPRLVVRPWTLSKPASHCQERYKTCTTRVSKTCEGDCLEVRRNYRQTV